MGANVADTIPLVTKICDFQQIPLFLHLLASLNLLEMNSDFTKPDGSGYNCCALGCEAFFLEFALRNCQDRNS